VGKEEGNIKKKNNNSPGKGDALLMKKGRKGENRGVWDQKVVMTETRGRGDF